MILCVGPFDGVTTGQKNCLVAAADSFDRAERVSVGGEGVSFFKTCVTVCVGLCRVLLYCFSHSERTLYLTPSRSAFGFFRDLIVFFPIFFFKSKRVAHWHGADVSILKASSPFIYQVFAFVYKRFQVHIVLTEGMREQVSDFITDGYSKVVVVPNFHDVTVSDAFHDKTKKVRVLYFSNVMVEKGALDFLAVAANTLKKNHNQKVEFHLAGPLLGLTAGRLNEELELLGLENQTCFKIHGAVYGEEKDRLLKDCDILLFPSVYVTEAFPLVVLEAMASGTYVIAYDHNYMSDILANDKGWLVPARDVGAMVSAVNGLIDNEDKLEELKSRSRRLAKAFDKESYRSRVRAAVLES